MADMRSDRPLSRTAASETVDPIGWRYLLGELCSSVPVPSLDAAGTVAAAAIGACGDEADGHLRVDLRPDRVELRLRDRTVPGATGADTRLALGVTAALFELGFVTTGSRGAERRRAPQLLELAIDTMDAEAIRPFWLAVLGHDEDPDGAVVDPVGQLPGIWFQTMDEPRQQRNRIHLDVTVPHDEADQRIEAALAAGGRLVSDSEARAFWILADADGNEVCICTWQDRDDRP